MRCPRCHSELPRAVEIGDARGRIALYLEKESAEALAFLLGDSKQAAELLEAVKRAYPEAAAV